MPEKEPQIVPDIETTAHVEGSSIFDNPSPQSLGVENDSLASAQYGLPTTEASPGTVSHNTSARLRDRLRQSRLGIAIAIGASTLAFVASGAEGRTNNESASEFNRGKKTAVDLEKVREDVAIALAYNVKSPFTGESGTGPYVAWLAQGVPSKFTLSTGLSSPTKMNGKASCDDKRNEQMVKSVNTHVVPREQEENTEESETYDVKFEYEKCGPLGGEELIVDVDGLAKTLHSRAERDLAIATDIKPTRIGPIKDAVFKSTKVGKFKFEQISDRSLKKVKFKQTKQGKETIKKIFYKN